MSQIRKLNKINGPRSRRGGRRRYAWEALSDEQLAEDCALPGGYLGGSYAAGWSQILARMVAAAEN